MRSHLTFSMTLSMLVLVCGLAAQEVVRCPDPNLSLNERWKWASRDVRRWNQGDEYWVGYSIRRLMNEGSFMGSGNFNSGYEETRRTLKDVISGDTARSNGNRENWNARPSEKNGLFKVLKDVAILFRVSGELDGERSLRKMEISNMDLHVDLRKKSLVWLGEADDDESVGLLTGLFERQSVGELRKNFMMAVGIHQNSKKVMPFLARILKSDQDDETRSQAAFWLSQQDNAESLTVLFETVQNDRSPKVKEQCVFALSQLSAEEGTDALIALARKSTDAKIRSRAAFWLGQKASKKAVATLETILDDDETTDVQRHALYALGQIHTPEGVDRLIKIARTHKNPRIRKVAIQCLGQSDDPRALEALIAIVRN